MIHSRWLILLPILAVFLGAIFAIEWRTYSIEQSLAAASTPPGERVLSTEPFEPRGPAAPVAAVEASAPAPVGTSSPTPTPAPAPTPAPKPKATTPRPTTQNKPATTTTTCSGSFTNQFICLLNQYRASKGLSKLSYDSALAGVALSHSTWMNQTDTFSHTGINGSRMTDRCQTAGTTCYGENLADGARSAQHLLDMWKASPGHNANLLRAGYKSAGLGISGSYVTLLFR